jgi:hypothetical protein
MAAQSKPAVVLSMVLALAVMGAAVGFVLLAPTEEPQIVIEQVAAKPAAVERIPEQTAPVEPPRPMPEPARPVPATDEPEPVTPPRSRMARDLERERIWSALGRKYALEPEAPGSAAPSESAAAHLPSLDPQYIRSAISEQLVPIAHECYQSALEDDPELGGKIVTRFVIVGAEDVGGVVEEAEISDDSTLDNAFVRECMRESLMAVVFEPPEDGGRIEVSYPFLFEPG